MRFETTPSTKNMTLRPITPEDVLMLERDFGLTEGASITLTRVEFEKPAKGAPKFYLRNLPEAPKTEPEVATAKKPGKKKEASE